MTAHLPAAVLSRFLDGESSNEEARAVVAHLLTGCPLCLSATSAVAGPPEEQGDAYDLAIQRAFTAVSLHGARAPQVKAEARRALERCADRPPDAVLLECKEPAAALEALLTRSSSLRH